MALRVGPACWPGLTTPCPVSCYGVPRPEETPGCAPYIPRSGLPDAGIQSPGSRIPDSQIQTPRRREPSPRQSNPRHLAPHTCRHTRYRQIVYPHIRCRQNIYPAAGIQMSATKLRCRPHICEPIRCRHRKCRHTRCRQQHASSKMAATTFSL